jgi:hypothetical protein
MGTRSVTYIHEMESLDEGVVCGFYRHFDGYPSGHGQDMANWLKDKKLVNGIGSDFDPSYMFNRAGAMSVKFVNHIQNVAGAEMIFERDADVGQDCTYHIWYRNDKFWIQIDDGNLIEAVNFNGEKIEEELYED